MNQTTPEAGYWVHTYNVFNQVATRTDARGVITTYTYDSLNRLYTISYNVGTTGVPATNTVTYTYGTSVSSNNNGRLTNVANTTVSDSFAYDVLGRITQNDSVINSVTYTTQYAYNLGGELTQVTYPSGRVVKQDFDAVGRLSKLYKDASTTYADTFAYSAAGQVTGFNYGNGVAASFDYWADRLQLKSLAYTKNSQDLLKLDYYYKYDGSYCTAGTNGNNGQIQCIKDSSNATLTPGANGRSVSYTYDALYRLSTATTAGSTEFPQWGLSWTYDRYGNRTNQSQTAGNPPAGSLAISNSTNRITETWAAYDANGNMTNDGLNSLGYDADNRMVSATGWAYAVDGAGLRVRKCTPSCSSPTSNTIYIFSGSKVIAEYDDGAGVTSPSREYVYLGSQLLAKFEGAATTYFHQDHLSNRVLTNSSGAISAQSAHYPFGEQWIPSSPPPNTKWAFTTYERDSESSNDYAIFRSYINRFGRFSSPDPVLGRVGFPQTLGRYAYVLNIPTQLSDPLGLNCRTADRFRSADAYSAFCGSGDPIGGSLELRPMTLGYNIFDAVAGAPGTYIYYDMYGRMSWGFSEELYVATLITIEEARNSIASGGKYDPRLVPTTGWIVLIHDYGVITTVSGLIPEKLAAVAESNRLNVAAQQAYENLQRHLQRETDPRRRDELQAGFDRKWEPFVNAVADLLNRILDDLARFLGLK